MKKSRIILVIAVVICFCACGNRASKKNIDDSAITNVTQIETWTEESVSTDDTPKSIVFANSPNEFIANDERADTILKCIFGHSCTGEMLGFPKEYEKQVVWYNGRKSKAIKFFNSIYPKTKYTSQQNLI